MEIEGLLRFARDHILLLAGGCIILIVMMLFSTRADFEQLFDRIHMYGTSNKIRLKKLAVQPKDEREKSCQWLIERLYLVQRLHKWRQRQIFLRETIIEFAMQGKLDKIHDLDNWGPRNWQHKLLNEAGKAWALTNEWHDLHQRKPEGPGIRLRDARISQIHKTLRNNPTKHLSQRYLVEACEARGGCCARACQCCMKPRGQYPDKRLYYAHCTLFCGCCVRSRGFVRHKEQGKDIEGLTDVSTTPFSIEGSGWFKVL
ncbi:hypothetical protein MGYG_08589 [Nannizzia gypsea CBS 118893]|uniref:Uncharacterized protein n=1 Tax=Arthroderma gypseum (strain ATCC MYA-4604 / CBS 118893) TaxID=535722 RepID=E4V6F0_ARTGP|nr:hypothetical protein MGYG_08589 [Nannizzia gypsea CBS 118893]EFQ96666.1 hypothetical protein MGYG_08589 [Nannizzia gypsea CBS 118893]